MKKLKRITSKRKKTMKALAKSNLDQKINRLAEIHLQKQAAENSDKSSAAIVSFLNRNSKNTK